MIKSLEFKKHRRETGLFIVQGSKSVIELLTSDYKTDSIFCTEQFYKENEETIGNNEVYIVSETVLSSLGTFETNRDALAVAYQKKQLPPIAPTLGYRFILDGINDPGNLGAIVRIADWFGLTQLICGPDTVDFYNPKVIAATKGSFTRILPVYLDNQQMAEFCKQLPGIAADTHGTALNHFTWPQAANIIIGSEANGIRFPHLYNITHTITIPGAGNTESLNAAVATGILAFEVFKQSQ